MLVVSACFAGVNCTYSGGNNIQPGLQKLVAEGKAIPVCPEQLGGLPTPRLPAEIRGGDGKAVWAGKAKVYNQEGKDVTEDFQRGAREVLALSNLVGASRAVLKEGSPSCGSGRIYDGSFTGTPCPGQGVTAALLSHHGIVVLSEDNWCKYSCKF
ncbi:MAG: 2-thiouracil desulfurase family protein [Bacillota bacterium]